MYMLEVPKPQFGRERPVFTEELSTTCKSSKMSPELVGYRDRAHWV